MAERRFVLADTVFADTAIRVGRELRDNPACRWSALGPDGERDAWEIFRKHDDKDWSYTDCSLLAISQRSGVRGIFAFDQNFSQMRRMDRHPRR